MDPSLARLGNVAPVGAIAETLIAGIRPVPDRPSDGPPDLELEVEQAIARHVAKTGVPLRHQGASFDRVVPRPGLAGAIEAARRVAAGELESLLLCGPPGTGKTLLAVSIQRERIEAHLRRWPRAVIQLEQPDGSIAMVGRPRLGVRFVVVPTFLDAMRAGVAHGDRDDPLAELFDVDLLVLDDLGAERSTDWAAERLYVLVSERYNKMRSTVATTNYGLDELVERGYGPIVSRLLEGGAAVRIDATDYRLEAH